ncbi:hypothetical protein HER10_EVM0000117 [Colletotrichum scovillei]|uniref:uncharacterized protein n=1 Tax=Colletotrichum scovillei TaxID=1209932 RepID=UPI0015C2F971|nr:uncharacterized protein HER10_EVM0000117 [Colletotrichum scovillei]KAF4782544.1 hypothetical protein HER10_EVM0000117 [Colletotrichum scovillei]
MASLEGTRDQAIDTVSAACSRFQGQVMANAMRTVEHPGELPEAFPAVAKRLPLLSKIFYSIRDRLRESDDDSPISNKSQAFRQIIESAKACEGLLGIIESMFDAATDGPKGGRYVALVEKNDGQSVEKLMERLLCQINEIAKPPWVTEEDANESRAALAEVRELRRSLANEQGVRIVMTNNGAGVQMHHSGRGSQNYGTGGFMVTGENHGATYNYGGAQGTGGTSR